MARASRLVVSCWLMLAWLAVWRRVAEADSFPANEFEFSLRRDELLAAEQKLSGKNTVLNEDEEIVNHYLQYLKWSEFMATKVSGFPPSRPIEEVLQYIQTTDIYKALQTLPKGGNMHSHEGHQLGKRQLLEIVWDSADFQHLYILPPDHPTAPWTLDFFLNPPTTTPPWELVSNSNFSFEEILEQQTLIGILTPEASRYPSDSGIRWNEINPLWNRGTVQLIANVQIRGKYLEAMYQQGFNEGVTYFETRANFGFYERTYELNSSADYITTNGKHFLEEEGDLQVTLTLELIQNVSKTNPDFIGHRRISYTHRQGSFEQFNQEMDNTVRLNKLYPDHVVGFDAVGQEDAGNSHLYYLENFLRLYNDVDQQSVIPLYLHTAETNWPDDLITADSDLDPVATLQNSYEALLLNSKRIGHGGGFIKHPYLLEVIRQHRIAIEVCVVSNQMLGYSPDLRNHPGLHYFRSGIPIILGADDPGTFGYDNFTVDWYEIFMAWGLDLSDLKTLALNSLNYSSMSDADKKTAIEEKWQPQWNRYITSKKTEACSMNFTTQAVPSFARILPREGPISQTFKVHVFGRNFETAICTTIGCKFGSQLSSGAVYISNQHLVCESPMSAEVTTVGVSIALDGINFISTGLNFTYKNYPTSTYTPTTTHATGVSSATYNERNLSVLAWIMLCMIILKFI